MGTTVVRAAFLAALALVACGGGGGSATAPAAPPPPLRSVGATAVEAQRIPMTARIRSIVEGSDGAIWLLEDAGSGDF